MKVQIGNDIYDGNDMPIILYLTPEDKGFINAMSDGARIYIQYPDDLSSEGHEIMMSNAKKLKSDNA